MKRITNAKKKLDFSPHAFLSTIGKGRDMRSFQKKNTIFAQGEPTDGLFFIQKGKVQLSVVSEAGKEATLGILHESDFFGEGGLAGQVLRHVVCNRDDKLRPPAHREEGDDACDESGTKIVGRLSQIFAETKHPLSG